MESSRPLGYSFTAFLALSYSASRIACSTLTSQDSTGPSAVTSPRVNATYSPPGSFQTRGEVFGNMCTWGEENDAIGLRGEGDPLQMGALASLFVYGGRVGSVVGTLQWHVLHIITADRSAPTSTAATYSVWKPPQSPNHDQTCAMQRAQGCTTPKATTLSVLA